ncbi:MAG TPA: TIGR02680 family protein [Solirubrobacteraceae bacterium]
MTAARFVPTRAGIVNLYEYADQTFEFADGRLLLRGHNTSGKTKVLELLFPFCLDGDISPTRLDPFAGTAKEMKWNLVGCVEQDNRVGYVWIEFERDDGHGGTERVTAGIGMKAWSDRPGVTRWYWILMDGRVGEDVRLVRPDREPLSRTELIAVLGDRGELLGTPSEYREWLRERVFGFATADEYRVMLELMRQLRRPHLSKSLDPSGVATMLSSGLPAVDDGLLRRLAGGLEQLEALEAGLVRIRANRTRLRSFHDRTYRAYAQALVRERGARLRSADTAARTASEALRAATSRAQGLGEEEARLAALQAEREAELTTLEGTERALVTSAAWASVAEVAQLGRSVAAERATAAARRDAAAEAADELVGAEAELLTATAALAAAEAGVGERLDEIDAVARAAGLAERGATLREQLACGLEPAAWRDALRDLARGTRAVLVRQGELRRLVRTAEAAVARARATLETAVERLVAARDLRLETEAQVEREASARTDAVRGWAGALRELTLEPDELAAVHTACVSAEDVQPLLAPAVGRVRSQLAAERATLEGRLVAVGEQRALFEDEARCLEHDHDEPPGMPPWARSPRDGRPGAPLWRAADLRAEVGDAERASIEAALHAAGLLDAWLTPDGSLLDPDTFDTLVGDDAPPVHGSTLAAVLRPDPAAPLDASRIERVLASVAYGPTAAGTGATAAIGADGSFVLGPLRGRGAKAQAEHLGASARAARRARRLAEVRTALDDVAESLRAIDASLERLTDRSAALDAELASFPPAAPLAAALRSLNVAVALEARAANEHGQAEAEAARHAAVLLGAQADRREHAVGNGLPPELDDDALEARREACTELAATVGGVARELAGLVLARETLAGRRERRVELRTRADERRREAVSAEQQAARLAAEHAARENALGEEGAALRRRHAEVTAALEALRSVQRADADALARVHDAARDAARDTRDATATSDAARGAREVALSAIRGLARDGLLTTALDAEAPNDAAQAGEWPLTRALEVVRGLPDHVTRVSTPSGELAQRVSRSVMDLGQELAEADLGVYTEAHDSVLVVRVTEGPADRTLDEVLRGLDLDLAERERLLSAEERRVFGATLVEELADHLRVRIRGVHDRVARMNAILRRCPTASGKTIQLDWRVHDDETLRPMVELLRRAITRAGPDDRDRLVEFFRRRIDAARNAAPGGAGRIGGEAMADTLAAAFDYRAWHDFDLLQEHGGTRERLTRKRHAVGSGGEQAVLIHLPLFAAAAALYDETTAPRMIFLDEALSGIDDDTRQRVLGATVDFGLDLVMTSHELWGTYITVPALAIYQLHRTNGEPGVHAIRFRWNGEVLRELEQAELLVG